LGDKKSKLVSNRSLILDVVSLDSPAEGQKMMPSRPAESREQHEGTANEPGPAEAAFSGISVS